MHRDEKALEQQLKRAEFNELLAEGKNPYEVQRRRELDEVVALTPFYLCMIAYPKIITIELEKLLQQNQLP